jgi:hypothetical protein
VEHGSGLYLRTDNVHVARCDRGPMADRSSADFRFDVPHRLGSRNPMDPLSRRGPLSRRNADAAAAWSTSPGRLRTGHPDTQSQEELVSRLGREAPYPAGLAATNAGWTADRRVAAATFAHDGEGARSPPQGPGGERAPHPPCSTLAGLALDPSPLQATGTTAVVTPPVPSDDGCSRRGPGPPSPLSGTRCGSWPGRASLAGGGGDAR